VIDHVLKYWNNATDDRTVRKRQAHRPNNKMKDEDGVMRWKINHEACFNYWNITGTDCGKCIQVCPFSHPNNLMHNIVRNGIKNSYLFGQIALQMDNLFYGKFPELKTNKFL
jgi:ferredoxin